MDIAYYLEAPLKIGLTILVFALFLSLMFMNIIKSSRPFHGDSPLIIDTNTSRIRKVWTMHLKDYKDPNIVLGGPIGIVLILLKIGAVLTVIGLFTWALKLILY